MCRTKATKTASRAKLLWAFTAAVSLALASNQARAVQDPAGCTINGLTYNVQKSANNVTNGSTVTFTALQFQNSSAAGVCAIQLGTTGFVFMCSGPTGVPNGSQTTLIPGLTLLPGGDPQPGFGPVNFTNTCVISVNPGVTSAQVKWAAPDALLLDNSQTPGDPANIDKTLSVNVFTPCISVTKACATNCTPVGQPIGFTGTVTNCGDITLINVGVVDDQAGIVLGPTNVLAVGATLSFSGSYVPSGSVCGPFTDTVTASGIAPLDTPAAVSATASATCHVKTSPAIDLTKDCYKTGSPGVQTLQPGDTYVEVFVVSNTGDIGLTNVVIHDDVLGDITIGALAVGQSVTNTTSPITPTPGFCGPITDHATATGDQICPPDATCPSPHTVTSAERTCTVTVLCPPDICVTKGVVCAPDSGDPCGPTLNYGPSATGAAGPTNKASFCYQIVVWNCGNDVLTNVTVVDNKISLVAGSFPTTLAIGQSVTNYYQQSYDADTITTNVVTATGTGESSGITTNKQAQAVAEVLPIGVECDITLSSLGAVEGGNCEVTLDSSNGTNQPVTFTLVVTNTGKVDLDVSLAGVPALVNCESNTPVDVPASVLIAVGGSYTISGCVPVSCPGADFNVTVQGTANAGTSGICIYDAEGNAVTTAPSQCSAHVCCVTPVTCRTTGGGQLIPGFTNPNCVEVETTIFPAADSDGNLVFKVTHGGQLGAPYAHQDCGEVLGNPCIRGQWEHNRHFEGKGNPRDTYTALHTVTPKGQFDSLTCACLPCCSDGEYYPATTGPGKKFELCNPDDHKICGPQPRPAPANALIWSGVGVLKRTSDTGTKGGEWVILRVYIEDRSEPGGGHPGGSVDPADIYSFQAWKTGIQTSKKPDFNAISPDFRRALAQDSCAFIEAVSSGALPPGSLPSNTVNGVAADVVDKGPLEDGNRQIHPSTSATCTQ